MGPSNGWEYFGEASLEACSPMVSNVFGSWQWNYFISAPVLSTLVSAISEDRFTAKSFDQQAMVDAACEHVSDTANQSYYPLSWQVIAMLTLNGEVAKAGALFAKHHTASPTKCQGSCGGTWMKKTDPSMQCIAKHGDCTIDIDACCGTLTCLGDGYYKQCL